jgi:hypothetical protein
MTPLPSHQAYLDLAAAGSAAHLWSSKMSRFMFSHSENGASMDVWPAARRRDSPGTLDLLAGAAS